MLASYLDREERKPRGGWRKPQKMSPLEAIVEGKGRPYRIVKGKMIRTWFGVV